LLLAAGRIDDGQLVRGLDHQRHSGGRLGDALVALGFLSEPALLSEVARQHGVSYVEIGERNVPQQIVRLIPEKYVRARRAFPFALGPDERRGKLFVATSEPQDLAMVDEVSFMTGMTVAPMLVSDRDLDRAIERHLGHRWSPASSARPNPDLADANGRPEPGRPSPGSSAPSFPGPPSGAPDAIRSAK